MATKMFVAPADQPGDGSKWYVWKRRSNWRKERLLTYIRRMSRENNVAGLDRVIAMARRAGCMDNFDFHVNLGKTERKPQ